MGVAFHRKHSEKRHQRKARLQEEGRWQAFLARRKGVADGQGITLFEADAVVYPEFLPGTAGAGSGVGVAGSDVGDRQAVEAPEPPERDDGDGEGDGDPPTEGKIPDAGNATDVGGTGRADAGHANVEYGETSNILADINWVYSHIGDEDDEVPRETAPSQGAWGLLRFVRSSIAHQSFFYANYHARLLPSRQDLEREQKRDRAARDVTGLLDKLIAKSENASLLFPHPEGMA